MREIIKEKILGIIIDKNNIVLNSFGYDENFTKVNFYKNIKINDYLKRDIMMIIESGLERVRKNKQKLVYSGICIENEGLNENINLFIEFFREYTIIIFERNEQILNEDTDTNVKKLFKYAVDELKKANTRLERIAYYDELTGLSNIHYLKELINSEINKKEEFILIQIKIERLNIIKEILDRKHLEELIKDFSNLLKNTLKEGEIISKIDDENFIIFTHEINKQDIDFKCESIKNIFKSPILNNDVEVNLNVKISIVSYPIDGLYDDELIKNLEIGIMNGIKRKETVTFFKEEMQEKVREKIYIENALIKALEKKALFMNYQPQIDLVSSKIVSCESLLRWNNEGILISPKKFIPIAEEIGYISVLGEWVINTVFEQASKWFRKGLIHDFISLNVSPSQFYLQNIVAIIENAINVNRVDGNKICIEITEGLSILNEEKVIKNLKKLKDLGVLIAIDDFGIGYSSFNYIKKFPIDIVKIDKSFIDGIAKNKEDYNIVKATIDMCNNSNIKTIAEGIEEIEQHQKLLNMGCTHGQGYYYSKPLNIYEYENFYQENKNKTISFEIF